MKPRLVIIADDLTGATDCSVAFAQRGIESSVLLKLDTPASTEVVAIDTGTRAMTAEDGATLTAQVVRAHAPHATIFKKIDSMLRGHVAAECTAALEAYRAFEPNAVLIMAPAFPAMGRTTVNGRQLVNGVEVGDLRAILPDAMVCDATSEQDLRDIVKRGLVLGRRALWCGTAGLARALAEMFPEKPQPPRPIARGPVLLVVGSASSISREQVNALPENIQPDAVISLDQRSGTGLNSQLCIDLARRLAPSIPQYGALVLTGGETARAVLDTMGVAALRVWGEVEPGVALSTTQSGLLVITKAGAFGTPDTLERCRTALKGSMEQLPRIAITMGDAAGVGPEIIMKSFAHAEVYSLCRPVVIGDAARLRAGGKLVGSTLEVRSIRTIDEARYTPGTVDCIDLGLIPADLPWGKLSAAAGHGAFEYVRASTYLAVKGDIEAICTAPLNKEALHAAGHKYPGHTELLAELTGTPEVSMMLTAPGLRVIHVTAHIGLLDAVAKIEPGLVERTIARGYAVLQKARIKNPRIAVCGINPHAGENGLFGRGEEEEKLVPAIQACQAKGWLVEGPLPADTLFYRATRGDFDMVVAMYHDQGHGPVKVLGLEAGVNITVGLPVIRTSVDHGTAFDIAGTGKADERSLLEALRQAAELAPRQRLS